MADQDITVPMDDKGLLHSIMADEPTQDADPAPAEVQPPEETGQPRDDRGRFAATEQQPAKAEPPPAVAAAEQPAPTDAKDDPAGNVPSWRLREVREAREAAERRADDASRQSYAVQQQMQALQRELAELRKPKQEPVNFFDNPDGAIAQRLSPLEERFEKFMSDQKLISSRTTAIAVHGMPAVSEMETAINQAMASSHPEMPLLAAQMRASDDPVSVAMQWHQRYKLHKETGGDITAYNTRRDEERLKDPAFLAKAVDAARAQAQGQPANGSRPPTIQLPPSISKLPGSAPNGSADDLDMSERGLFKQAFAR